MKLKSALAATVVLGMIAVSHAAFAADEYNTSNGLTAVGKPLGMHGVDPVAFVNLGNRITGAARHTATHDGVAYYFSSAETMKAFKAEPGLVSAAEWRLLHLRCIRRQEVRWRSQVCGRHRRQALSLPE